MADSREQSIKATRFLMWVSFLLTFPSWIFWVVDAVGGSSFHDTLIENGSYPRYHLISIVSLLLPIIGLVIALFARLRINAQNSKYNFYPDKSNLMVYNNALVGYFISLGIVGFILLNH